MAHSENKGTDLLSGTEGEYLGIYYKWSKDNKGHVYLTLTDNGIEHLVFKTDKPYEANDPNMIVYHAAATKHCIELYLEKKHCN